jgi:hypothetical protein
MKRVIAVMILLTLASVGRVFGDESTSLGTITYDLVSVSGANNGSVYCGPYSYSFTKPNPGSGVPEQLYSMTAGHLTANGQPDPKTIVGFCVDYVTDVGINQPINSNIYQLDGSGTVPSLVPGQSATDGTGNVYNLNKADSNGDSIRKLVGYYIQLGNSLPPGSMTNTDAVGLQLALWKLINGKPVDNGWIQSSGGVDFTSANGAEAFANTLLSGYQNTRTLAADVLVLVPNGSDPVGNYQLQGIMFDGTATINIPDAPEPRGLVALGSLGLCCVPFGARYLRRGKAPLI